MIAVAFRRVLSKFVASRRVLVKLQGVADRGWQGKRPAVGPALVVGWIGQFALSAPAPAIASANYPNEINLDWAISQRHEGFLPHDNARR
ncbi:hypothetical protein [Bradyrhizobium sp. DASA03120]|uniref:hypothetical protein n=1 Tax=Bradyrhizobium sp. SMVTL-02 TaxID=3395917 RepID=UPI003F730637